MTRSMNIIRKRPGRNAFGRGSPAAISSLSNCAKLGLNPKRLATANSRGQRLVRLQKKRQRGRIRDKFNF